MTPKEKAKELIDIYKKQVSMTIKDYSLVCKVLDIDMAKQCALIAVDEIINTEFQTVTKLLDVIQKNKIRLVMSLNVDYWQEVKKEIEKL
jgi:alpha-N-acetylglucosamine transferase